MQPTELAEGRLVRHVRTGGLYQFVAYATHSETQWPMAVYRNVSNGRVWVRPREMFEDGRFEALPSSCAWCDYPLQPSLAHHYGDRPVEHRDPEATPESSAPDAGQTST